MNTTIYSKQKHKFSYHRADAAAVSSYLCVFQCKVNLHKKKSLKEDDDVKVYVQSFENSIFVFFNFYIFYFSVNRRRCRHATQSLYHHMRDEMTFFSTLRRELNFAVVNCHLMMKSKRAA